MSCGRLEVGLDPPAELDEPRQLGGRDVLLEGGVEGAAEGDVDGAAGRLESPRPDERGHVAEPDRAHAAALDLRPRLEAAGRDVDDDAVLALPALDHALVERPGDERDRPVAAGGRVALVVEEDDAEVGAVVVRRHDVAAVHVRMAARLVDDEPAVGVEVVAGEPPPLEDRRARERRHARGQDPERLAARVVVDRLDVHA